MLRRVSQILLANFVLNATLVMPLKIPSLVS